MKPSKIFLAVEIPVSFYGGEENVLGAFDSYDRAKEYAIENKSEYSDWIIRDIKYFKGGN